MQRIRKKLIAIIVLSILMIGYPSSVLAADFSFSVNIVRQDGATCGELWLNDKVVWRLAILADGAKPVFANANSANTTLVIPDIVNGMFVLKVE
ncbi:hypothetical protein [Sporomusa acidovorans]|uniref:Uncharacterized protein n=1 Tax=Sporomusa acidovorans (strain ATCC 49682 / DSM 3132 / Mol) TaxID=1123286 RepID=A0ABZ3IX67_SPOA4|nr:hypothetical protein [Sporomusa acidovorans]OZC13880.1 hypothetical protein SPACI_54760 [Sporomusa acidovorans DSM 3132]SDF48730.1 hypothetical protein SAMN04488499_105219 [Sporomusa acidovorans]